MKVILSRTELATLIGKIQSVVSVKAAIPILANILLEARNGHITLSATDLTVSLKAEMEANILEEGAITLPARRFFQLIREISGSEIKITCSSDATATVESGTSHFRLKGIDRTEFPSLPSLESATTFKLPGSTFKEVLSKSVFAAAKEDSRHVLNGVLMHIEEGEATFIGTDGKRLAKVFTSVTLESAHTSDYLIPIKAVEEAVKMIEEDCAVTVSLLPDKIGLDVGGSILVTKLLSGKYPDVERVIPESSEVTVTLHREELMSLLKQIALFTSDKSHSVHFSFNPGELTLTANSSDIGDGKVHMPVNYSGKPIAIAFNPFFFHDILRHCKDETISFSITDPHNPGLITDSSKAKFVIMPMRLNPV